LDRQFLTYTWKRQLGRAEADVETAVQQLWKDFMRYVDRLDTQEWTLVFVVVILVGFFCLRGFGSRANY